MPESAVRAVISSALALHSSEKRGVQGVALGAIATLASALTFSF
jgi:hypothetical protein